MHACMQLRRRCHAVKRTVLQENCGRMRCSLGYYKGRVSVVCVCYSLLLSSVCYTVVLRYSSMIMYT